MQKFIVFYYDIQIDAFHAADLKAAVRTVGLRWAGMAGVTVREA